MHKVMTILLGLGTLSLAGHADARGFGSRWHPAHERQSFRRIATLPNYRNNASIDDTTVSEIVASTEDGNTLVYTDGELAELGFVDISDPAVPVPIGKLELEGEPTSVAVLGSELALVGVNTSESFASPSGHLAVVDIDLQVVLVTIPLGGQPDSVAISPDGTLAAVVIENERDEDVSVDGVEGGLPQTPAGLLHVVDIDGLNPTTWGVRDVALTGLSEYAPDDPEPEFVDIDDFNRAVVTLQENNHVIVVDLESGRLLSDFSAGSETLVGVDATEDDLISLSETLVDVPREPDAVTWLPGPGSSSYVATANEGDLFGGSRGFSIFDTNGSLIFDSGSSFEEIAVRHGHYPEARSENKGSEPESIEYARFGRTDYLFVGSERGSFVAVYELDHRGLPEFVQLLPAPLGPEGLHAIPSKGLLVASGEEDDPPFGVRSSVMIYELGRGAPSYPQIASANDAVGKPIAWSALSGLTAVPGRRDQLLAVSDSFYAELSIFTIDASSSPAIITSATPVVGGSGDFDGEGIAVAPDGTYWIASEGNATSSRPNRLLQTDPSGQMLQEVFLPAEVEACRAASDNRGSLGAGFEGVAVSTFGRGYDLLVAQQRGWDYTTPECEDLDDDPDAVNAGEPGQTRLWRYDPDDGTWSHHAYALEAVPDSASWVGLSEITAVPGGYVVIERDNRTGDFAELKTLVRFSGWDLFGGVSRAEKRVRDLLPDLLAQNGWISDKAEGFAVTRNGNAFLVTDNDGVDDWSGETTFLSLGRVGRLF